MTLELPFGAHRRPWADLGPVQLPSEERARACVPECSSSPQTTDAAVFLNVQLNV